MDRLARLLPAFALLILFACARPYIEGTPARLIFTDSLTSLSMTTVSVLNSTTTYVNISNVGETSASKITSSFPGSFSFAGGVYPGTGGTCGSSIAAKETCRINLSFSPTVGGAFSGNFSFGYFDGVVTQSLGMTIGASSVAQGSIDATFNSGGSLTLDYAGAEKANKVLLRSDGRIVVAGSETNGGNDYFSALRLDPNGAIDTAFATNGRVITVAPASSTIRTGTLQTADGKILVAGNCGVQVCVRRYLSSGTLDNTFGTLGISMMANLTLGANDTPYDMIVQADGKIIVVGETVPLAGNTSFFALRLSDDGNLDVSIPLFGLLGAKVIPVNIANHNRARAIAIQSDGKLLIGGYTKAATKNSAIVRLDQSTGIFDVTYNGTGIASADVCGYGADDELAGIGLQSDDKAVIVGYCVNGSGNRDLYVSRYNTDGTLDTLFGTGGKVILNPSGFNDEAMAVAIQSNNKIVVAGYTNNGTKDNVILVRLNANGTYDTPFGTGGVVTTSFGTGSDRALSLIIQPADGKILLGGNATNGTSDFLVARFYP